jgi:Zn-finger nucleic acid-binding protein
MALSCPGCGSSLKTAHRGKVEVDLCPRCGGAWFDRDELRPVLIALASQESTKEDAFSPGARKVIPAHQIEQMGRRCPRDHFTLRTINYSYDSNVLVDRCP